MIKEIFFGKGQTPLQINPILKVFMLSEMMLWSAWSAFSPIFALFAVTLPGAGVETAAFAYSIYLITRVIVELISGRLLVNSGDLRKFVYTITGIIIISIAYFGFAFSTTVPMAYLFYAVAGLGIGIASPAKNTLFATHLDPKKETFEWGLQDALVFFTMALAAFAGGLVAHQFGFMTLFLLIGGLNLASILPYVLYINNTK